MGHMVPQENIPKGNIFKKNLRFRFRFPLKIFAQTNLDMVLLKTY